MRRLATSALGVFVLGMILLLVPGKVFAANEICDSLTLTLCTVSTAKNLTIAAGGSLTREVDRDMLITSTGSINVLVPDLGLVRTLNLNVAGALTIEAGGKITGDALAGNRKGATININATGKISLQTNSTGAMITSGVVGGCSGGGHAGIIDIISTYTPVNATDVSVAVGEKAVISVNGTNPGGSNSPCPAGDITIEAPNGRITIDGTVESAVDSGSTGNGRAEDGGPITIIAGCDLLLTGKASSRGMDNGADRVHLEAGCSVNVTGTAESIGAGHITNGKNVCHGTERPDKPASANFCVEIWSGGTVDISGEVRADITQPGGQQGDAWVDIFAVNTITITGDTGPFAVHSNGGPMTSDQGGVVTIKSRDGKVKASGNAIAANAIGGSGGQGGQVTVEAKLDVDLTPAAKIEARGTTTGGAPKGGNVSIRSFGTVSPTGSIVADSGSNINVTGGASPNGSVALEACGSIDFPPGTVTPVAIVPTLTFSCGGAPTFQSYVIFPDCGCKEAPPEFGFCLKAPVRSVLDPVTGRFPGNKGPDLIFRLDINQDADGHTTIQEMVDNATDKNGDNYIILGVVKDKSGIWGGHTTQSVDVNQVYLLPFALIGCSVTMHDPDLQDILPTGLIGPLANAPQPKDQYGKTEPGNIFVMDLHGADSEVAGWKIEGDGRYFRNVYGIGNGTGLWFAGNLNTMHNGKAESNSGDGLLITGDKNLVDSADAMDNGAVGVEVTGSGNTIKKVDIGDSGKGNAGDGLNVAGDKNYLQENDVHASGGFGIKVTGSFNTLLKNSVGDRGKGNGSDGIYVTGAGNTLQENEAYANLGHGFNVTGGVNTLLKNKGGDRGDKANGLAGFYLGGGGALTQNTAIGNLGDGFTLTTSGFTLKNNVSGGTSSGYPNGGCQYNFLVAGNVNAGGNKSNGVTLVGTPFPAGCK